MQFHTELIITEVPMPARNWRKISTIWARRKWQLKIPLVYDEIVVPKGFVTDFATIPRILWPIFPPYGRHTKAAILHDYLYTSCTCSRRQSDKIFREAMKKDGVGWLRRGIMWAAVRLFGRTHYG